jgi:hypothetical protein
MLQYSRVYIYEWTSVRPNNFFLLSTVPKSSHYDVIFYWSSTNDIDRKLFASLIINIFIYQWLYTYHCYYILQFLNFSSIISVPFLLYIEGLYKYIYLCTSIHSELIYQTIVFSLIQHCYCVVIKWFSSVRDLETVRSSK